MEALEKLEMNQRVIEDFTSRTLVSIPTEFGRLCYLSSLRDSLAGGRYVHEGLAAVFPDAAVQEALEFCHWEIFGRILESPLARQEWDLRGCLSDAEGDFWQTLEQWRETGSYRLLGPADSPRYLRELFSSNVRTLLDVLAAENPTLRSAA
jgi:hypothetical protein